MRFRPRHYVLIAIIVALGVFNIVRARHPRQPQSVTVSTTPQGPVPQSPAWAAFDKAAGLRDAPDSTFQPALQDLKHQAQTAPAGQKADLDGCQTWLLFYRQGAMHAASQDAWRQRSMKHLNDCVAQHRDISS
jgi:hypothetical protein